MESDRQARILIVEDDPGIAQLERRALRRAGFDAEAAADPEAAAALLAQEAGGGFDLVVLDYQLTPTTTGLDLFRRLRADRPELAAILVTGFADQGKVIEALRAGVRDVVPKAGEYLEYLQHAVRRVLQAVHAEQRLAASEEALRQANAELERRVAERTAELARTKELAEAANRAKDHFLAVLSHELRTPLTPVLTTVQILEERADVGEAMHEQLAMIRRNVELEARLIDDLLDLTSIARGKIDLHFEPVDVHRALHQVLEICDRDRRAKQLRLDTDLAAGHPVAMADPARLQQLLWNVVKNAIKFTPEGGQVQVRTRAGVPGRLVVEVEDSGIGIQPEAMPHIFDAFEQGGREVTRLFGGLGLGLAICKTLTELHGGSIAAVSAGRGLGSTFIVELPQAAEVTRAPELPESQAAAPHVPLRILLVEDHADSRRALAQLLEIHRHRVETAASIAEALDRFGPRRFDLVISDLGLPDGSGLDLLRELRRRASGGLWAICLSGFGMEDDRRKSREAGFLAHLTKPVSLQALTEALDLVQAAVTGGPAAGESR